jgi:thiaminase
MIVMFLKIYNIQNLESIEFKKLLLLLMMKITSIEVASTSFNALFQDLLNIPFIKKMVQNTLHMKNMSFYTPINILYVIEFVNVLAHQEES